MLLRLLCFCGLGKWVWGCLAFVLNLRGSLEVFVSDLFFSGHFVAGCSWGFGRGCCFD